MSEKISIAGLDKAAVLAALHNGTRAVGMGVVHDIGRDMTVEEARGFLEAGRDTRRMFGDPSNQPKLYFDYLKGRPLKVDISGDEFDPRLYDRDAAPGAAQRAIDKLKQHAAFLSVNKERREQDQLERQAK